MSWTPEFKQQQLSIEGTSSHLLTSHEMRCPECGFTAKLEVDTAKGPCLFHHRFRVCCAHTNCDHATGWMDSSEEAVKNWRMQIILKRE